MLGGAPCTHINLNENSIGVTEAVQDIVGRRKKRTNKNEEGPSGNH